MEYCSVQETAERWGLSVRRVQHLCKRGMVEGATLLSKVWLIPKDAKKPKDNRYKENEEVKNTAPFLELAETESMFSRIIEFFPYAIQVYSPDGTLLLTNDACLRLLHIPSKDLIVGKFNVLKDPVIDNWGQGVREVIARSFEGETVQFENLQMPIQKIIDRFETDDLCFGSSFLNITCFPVFDDHAQLVYVVHVFVTSKIYNGKEEMVKAIEYIETHWFEAFELDEVARSVYLSRYHFSRLFKRYTALTPFSYYQNIKINKIKERLLDHNLSIHEAFSACGVDYNGHYARLFKEKVGMTPSQYRKTTVPF